MPTPEEYKVGRAHQVHFDRDLAQAVADFYLLETLVSERDTRAASLFEPLVAELATEFAAYLDIAIGGELRHARKPVREAVPQLRPYFTRALPAARFEAWIIWSVIRKKFGPEALDLAEKAFSSDGWPNTFGGKPWARATGLLRNYLTEKIPARIFVDQTFSLQHNTGSIFNKLYNTRPLAVVLTAHGIDDYASLLGKASAPVRRAWSRRGWHTRVDHDPIWLGVQPEIPAA